MSSVTPGLAVSVKTTSWGTVVVNEDRGWSPEVTAQPPVDARPESVLVTVGFESTAAV